MRNLAGDPAGATMQVDMAALLREIQRTRGDELVASTTWSDWLDPQRRVVRNAFGVLPHPEAEPDWSLL